MIAFVSGGARSGKSRYAEQMAEALFQKENQKLIYVATAQARDQEMNDRIRRHREDRRSMWETLEEAYDFTAILQASNRGDVLLLDCLTFWVNNMLFRDTENRMLDRVQLQHKWQSWLNIAEQRELHLIIVSNDMNEAIPHCNNLVRNYTKELQGLHQVIVLRSEQAIQVIAGVPIYWKGGSI